jgi:hypothetical protein
VQRLACRGDVACCGFASHLTGLDGAHDPAPIRCPVKRVAARLICSYCRALAYFEF